MCPASMPSTRILTPPWTTKHPTIHKYTCFWGPYPIQSGKHSFLNMALQDDESLLPPDLWFEIATLVEPRDVLTMKLVCKTLHQIFASRKLWVYVLLSVCHQHSLFLPSYPIGDMALDELQRAALGPYRWARLIRRKGKRCVQRNASIRVLKPLKESGHVLESADHLQFLVPGGRFLLTARWKSLFLWDLGVVGRPSLSRYPTLIVRKTFQQEGLALQELTVIPLNKTTLRIAVSLVGKEEMLKFKVYDISPGTQEAKLKRVGSLTVQTKSQEGTNRIICQDLLIHGNRLHASLTSPSISFIWDFSADRYTLGPRQMGNSLSASPPKVFTGTSVIEFGRRRYTGVGHTILRLCTQQRSSKASPSISSQPPSSTRGISMRFLYPTWRALPALRLVTTVHPPSPWHHGSVFPITFNIIRERLAHTGRSDDSATCHRYQLDVKADLQDPFNALKTDVTFKVLGKFYLPSGWFYTPQVSAAPVAGLDACYSGMTLLKMFLPRMMVGGDSEEVIYSMSSLSSRRGTPRLWAKVTPLLRSSPKSQTRTQLVCSATGRIVYTVQESDPAVRETRVSDYLSPWLK
ncbi:hypothetical protein DFP72DRAFT_891124 [Ephemerocybe angulata]|uniref:F-box domain-containing protein n=1 Tax=Ephemerocybe angulata TaxID=980116 RepID=A0A8H6M6C4_9AGAR|nr:hypothetical protein DFP72DRAFT_891124 [Tulosesus angulatus]